jgi:FkbM family methyltransferase
MPPSRLRQLLKFLRVFGVSGGLRLWWSLIRQANAKGTLELPVPGLRAPLRVRPRDLPIFWQIWVMRENDFSTLPQARQVQATYEAMLAQGRTPVIVDCGAHIGLSAVWFATRFPAAKVYSVEPSDANFSMLQANTRPYANVEPINGGVWSQSCHLEISNPNSGSASFQLREVFDAEATGRTDLLRAFTIDEIAHRDPNGSLLLTKIDIEGAEAEVFRSPAPWMSEVPVIVTEIHDWLLPGQGTSRNLFRRIGEQGFDVVLQGENLLLFRTQAAPARAEAPRDPAASALLVS